MNIKKKEMKKKFKPMEVIKNFLVIWIIFQLVFIGFALWEAIAEVDNGTFECTYDKPLTLTEGRIIGTIFPLIFFGQANKIRDYCANISITIETNE